MKHLSVIVIALTLAAAATPATAQNAECLRIGTQLTNDLQEASTRDGICQMSRAMASALRTAHSRLRTSGCATSSELADLQTAAEEAEATARAAC